MSLFSKVAFLSRSLFARRKLDEQLSEEVQAHVEMATAANVAKGMSRDEARHAALREFGNVASIQQQTREARGWVWLEQLWQDTRHALRSLRKTPGFTVIAIGILGIGIGATTAVFTLIDRVLFQQLAVNRPGELVIVTKPDARAPRTQDSFSYPAYAALRDQTKTLSSLAGFSGARRLMLSDTGDGDTSWIQSQDVSGNFFPTLGVATVLGRALSPADDMAGNPQAVVVLSHSFWQRRFGSAPDMVGKGLVLDDVPFTIVGVAARGFAGPGNGEAIDVWLPLAMLPRLEPRADRRRFEDDQAQWLFVLGRRHPGVERPAARTELDVIFQRALASFGWNESQRRLLGSRIELQPGAFGYERLGPELKPMLPLLLALVGVVLLLACANVAGLLFARTLVRQRELAVRAALGASRGRLLRQLLTESLLLAGMGGLLGLGIAQGGTQFLHTQLALSAGIELQPNAHVLLFALLVSMVTGGAVGLSSAVRLTRRDPMKGLQAPAGVVGAGSRGNLSQVLVMAQVSLSVGLVMLAGLFGRSLHNLRHTDPGFDGQRLLVGIVEFGNYFDAHYREDFFRQLQAGGLEALPGVRSVTTSDGYMFAGAGPDNRKSFAIDGESAANDGTGLTEVTFTGPRFFETFGLPLLRGRGFDNREAFSMGSETGRLARGTVVINETVARKYFSGRDPIGRRIRFTEPFMKDWPPLEVIGVSKDAKYGSLRDRESPRMYVPYGLLPKRQRMWLQVRTEGDPLALVPSLREIVGRVDPGARLLAPSTMARMIETSVGPERVAARTAGLLSVVAVTLAGMGLYALLAYAVFQRTREIGVRMALGATPQAVINLIVHQGLRLTLAGCALGIVAAIGIGRLIESRLFGVSPGDPATLAATVIGVLVVALLACWLPARRAAKVDPMVALRAE